MTAAPDLLVIGGDVVTMNVDRQVLVGGAIAVAGSTIVGLASVGSHS